VTTVWGRCGYLICRGFFFFFGIASVFFAFSSFVDLCRSCPHSCSCCRRHFCRRRCCCCCCFRCRCCRRCFGLLSRLGRFGGSFEPCRFHVFLLEGRTRRHEPKHAPPSAQPVHLSGFDFGEEHEELPFVQTLRPVHVGELERATQVLVRWGLGGGAAAARGLLLLLLQQRPHQLLEGVFPHHP